MFEYMFEYMVHVHCTCTQGLFFFGGGANPEINPMYISSFVIHTCYTNSYHILHSFGSSIALGSHLLEEGGVEVGSHTHSFHLVHRTAQAGGKSSKSRL